jgi:hypothetical protein
MLLPRRLSRYNVKRLTCVEKKNTDFNGISTAAQNCNFAHGGFLMDSGGYTKEIEG